MSTPQSNRHEFGIQGRSSSHTGRQQSRSELHDSPYVVRSEPRRYSDKASTSNRLDAYGRQNSISNVRQSQSPRNMIRRDPMNMVELNSASKNPPSHREFGTPLTNRASRSHDHSGYAPMAGKRYRETTPVLDTSIPRPGVGHQGPVRQRPMATQQRLPTAMFRARPSSGRVFAGARQSTSQGGLESFL